MIQKIKIINTLIIIFSLSFSFSANAQTVEEIIKGRKAMFSENYQNAKKISILLKSKRIEEAKEKKCKMLLQIHDELIFEVPKESEKNFTNLIRQEMTSVKDSDLHSFSTPLTVDVNSGENWGLLH